MQSPITSTITPPISVNPQQPQVPPLTQKKAFLYMIFRDQSIQPDTVNAIKKEIKASTIKELNLVINSGGGDTYSAVKIIRILRSKFTKITALVPYRAMSAATLILLGTDEIFMSEESQLGPLDLPMEHPVDGSRISSVDVVNTLSSLSTTMMSNADSMYKYLREDLENGEKIGKHKSIELALQYSTKLILPITEKIDPYHRQVAYRKLRIAQWYAYDLLRTKMIKDPDQAWITARKFVYNFPDHSYAIFREEAKDTLRLTIKDATHYRSWDEICNEVNATLIVKTPYIKYIEK